MRARVLFFGILKDVVGRPAEDAEFPGGTSLTGVLESYARRHPRLREMTGSILVARNQEFADPSTPLEDGDEVAFLPPVSGGNGIDPVEVSHTSGYFALTRIPIDVRALAQRLIDGAEGAVVTFEGTVRNNTAGRRTRFLDYECYEPMALKTMVRIGQELAAERPIARVGMVHRLGRLLVGETSIAIVVTAAHRRPAFEAALEAIDRVKKVVPIWKKEYFVDGEVWVEGEWGNDLPRAL